MGHACGPPARRPLATSPVCCSIGAASDPQEWPYLSVWQGPSPSFHPRCLTFLAGCVAPTPELGVRQGLDRPDQLAPTCSRRPSAQPTASTRSLGPGHAVAAPHDPLGTLQAVMQASPFAGAGLGPFEDAAPHPAGPLDAYRHGSSSGRDARCVQGPRAVHVDCSQAALPPPPASAAALPPADHGRRCDCRLMLRLSLTRCRHVHPPLSMSAHRRSLDDAGLLHTATSAGSGAAFPTAASLGSLGRSASVSNPFDMTELLARISLLPPAPPPPPALDSASSGGGPRCLSTDGVNRMQWVQPSGEAALLLLANGCLPGSIVASSENWGKKWGCGALASAAPAFAGFHVLLPSQSPCSIGDTACLPSCRAPPHGPGSGGRGAGRGAGAADAHRVRLLGLVVSWVPGSHEAWQAWLG